MLKIFCFAMCWECLVTDPFPAKKINKNCCVLSTHLAYFEASKETKTEAEEEVEDVLNITQSILLRLFYFALWRVSFPTEKINKNCCVFTSLPFC